MAESQWSRKVLRIDDYNIKFLQKIKIVTIYWSNFAKNNVQVHYTYIYLSLYFYALVHKFSFLLNCFNIQSQCIIY